MCFTPKPQQQAQTPAAPPPPPANSPQSPILNEATASSANGAAWNTAQRRGTNSLTIGLATPSPSNGAGLAIG